MRRALLVACLCTLISACGKDDTTPDSDFAVDLSGTPITGTAPLTVNFNATPNDSSGEIGYIWDFGNGVTANGNISRSTVYSTPGNYAAKVKATKRGTTVEDTLNVTVTDVTVPVDPANQNPVVELSASPTSGTAPLTVDFTAAGSDPDGDPLSYAWNFGDGSSPTDSVNGITSHTFSKPGKYAVGVIVSDGKGGTAQAEVSILISASEPTDPTDPTPGNDAPTVNLTATPAAGPAPLNVTLNANATDPEGDALSYSWDFGNGGKAEGKAKQTIAYTDVGSYTATVTVSDGTQKTSDQVLIKVNENPAPPSNGGPQDVTITTTPATLTGPAPFEVSFSASATDPEGDKLIYVWEFGDETMAGGATATHVYQQAGSYTGSVTVGDAGGSKIRKEFNVTVTGSGNGGDGTPFYGQWSWTLTTEQGETHTGYLNVSSRYDNSDDGGFVEGGKGSWVYCGASLSSCENVTGSGSISLYNYGGGNDLVVDASGGNYELGTTDADGKIGTEDGGRPTIKASEGAWIVNPGGQWNNITSFTMSKISDSPQ